LDLDHEHLETLAIWGIRTLGEFAALPEHELVSRLGANASRWRDLACGSAAHTFQPIEPAFSLWEYCEFETPVENMESLLFVAVRMIESMAARATGRALCIASLDVCMRLDGGREHRGAIKPALPTADRKFLLKLLQLEIAAHPPSAAVVALTLTAEVGQSSKVQLGLFSPQTPEPSRLDVTLARLKAIVGEDRVGSPVLEDTHRSGRFHLEQFSSDIKTSIPLRTRSNMALRRIRPPMHVQVVLHAMRPTSFRERSNSFEITAAYGAWRTTGCWWSMDRLDTEEWDILAAGNDGSSIVALLIHDLTKNQWWLEALYD
jgi:protein ImuB